jgi:hypothetical protein
MDNDAGLREALNEGDAVVLSTGATATVRGSYPKGYCGDVRILLGDVEELERADGFLVTHPQPMPDNDDVVENAGAEMPSDSGLVRAPNRRMQD